MVKRILLYLIRIYQCYLSSLFPPVCRFYPTCSQYTYICIDRFGIGRGIWYSLKRVLRCHPFSQGGFDPPPLKEVYGKETFFGHHSFNNHSYRL